MEVVKSKKATFELWEVLLIAFVSSLIMSCTTGYVAYRNKSDNDCLKMTNNPYLGEFIKSYNSILNDYYTEVDESGLIESAINGMMSFLGDPYSSYLNESNTEYLIDSLKGTYEGIGIQIKELAGGVISIEKVFEDTPATKAGLKANDVIKKIGGTEIKEKTTTDVVNLIKNNKDKKIVIVIERDKKEFTFEITKQTLNTPIVSENVYEKNNQKIGYLRVERFAETVGEQFKNKLGVLENESINSLIIDLRDNTGGYLKGATEISSIFLKPGATIYSLKTKLKTISEKDVTADSRDYKVYILINKASASASEVLAAALKDNYKNIKLIGENSYGKGKVQQTSNLTSGSMLKYTTAEWLTPKGICIDGIGLKPDIEVKLSDEYLANPTVENDNQLQTTIFEISK